MVSCAPSVSRPLMGSKLRMCPECRTDTEANVALKYPWRGRPARARSVAPKGAEASLLRRRQESPPGLRAGLPMSKDGLIYILA